MRAIDGDRLKRKAQKVATEAWKMKTKATVEVILNQFIDWINDAPTIEPERKKGKWIKHIDDLFPAESTLECNRCHHEQSIIIDDNYCPNCGADMREDAEEPKKCDTCKHEKERWPMWCHRCEYYLLWEGKE